MVDVLDKHGLSLDNISMTPTANQISGNKSSLDRGHDSLSCRTQKGTILRAVKVSNSADFYYLLPSCLHCPCQNARPRCFGYVGGVHVGEASARGQCCCSLQAQAPPDHCATKMPLGALGMEFMWACFALSQAAFRDQTITSCLHCSLRCTHMYLQHLVQDMINEHPPEGE